MKKHLIPQFMKLIQHRYCYHFLTNSVERIIALESAQHFKPFNDFISESHRVLKKGGILTFAIPVVKKNSIIKNLGILALTWSSEHYEARFCNQHMATQKI